MSIKLQILLNFRENVSLKSTGNHTCWSVRHPVSLESRTIVNSCVQLREFDVDVCIIGCSKLRQGDKFTSTIYSGASSEPVQQAGPSHLWVKNCNHHCLHCTWWTFVVCHWSIKLFCVEFSIAMALCGLRDCKNRAHSFSWPEVVKAIPNQGLDCFVS